MTRYLLVLLVLLFCSVTTYGQRLMIGEKLPDMNSVEWLERQPVRNKKVYVIEFLHTKSQPSASRLEMLADIATNIPSLDIITIFKEPREAVAAFIGEQKSKLYPAIDKGGGIFTRYGIRFVPFSIVVDKKGAVLWFGNSSLLTESEMRKIIIR